MKAVPSSPARRNGGIVCKVVVALAPLFSVLVLPAEATIQSFPVVPYPAGLVFDGSNVWISSGTEGRVTRLRASDGSPNGTFTVGGGSGALAFDGQNIWKASDDMLFVIRASDGAPVANYFIPAGAILFDGTYIWAAGFGGLQKVRPSDGTVVLFVSFDGRGAYGLTFDGRNIWATLFDYNTLKKVRASDGTIEGTFNVGSYPLGVAFDGANIWVANTGDETLTKLRARDGALVGTFAIPAAELIFDGKHLWAPDDGVANVVRRVRPGDGAIEQVYRVGQVPQPIIFDGSSVWVGDFYGKAVNKISPP